MKPSHITAVLDLAYKARQQNEIMNPMFTGDAGLGKSQICQAWVEKQRERNLKFGFVDLRIAYLEAPDLIGFPETAKDHNGLERTCHRLPEFWPTEGEGLILLEEPNRGTTGVMNCLMQLLTDRKVHNYTLPKGWLIAACVNPDSSEYDVNTMDAALKDRFEEFEVEYDPLTFMNYMEDNNWHNPIQRFVGDAIWTYKSPKEIGQNGKYISPRTWSKVNAAERADVSKDRILHRLTVCGILGKDIGNEYHSYCFDQAPVTAADIIKDKKAAFKRLKEQCAPDTYRGDMIPATIDSIVKAYGGKKPNCKPDEIDEDTMVEVAKIIPADLTTNLIKQCGFKVAKGKMSEFLNQFVKDHPELISIMKSNIKLNRATKVDDEADKAKAKAK
jgi:hypothetical protein